MSTRPEITAELSELLRKHLNPHNDPRIYIAREVTFDYYSDHIIRVDFMRFKPVNNTVSGIEKGDFFCYEVKSSIEDFHSKNGHNFIGDYNYYVMPETVYDSIQREVPFDVGVLVPHEERWGNRKSLVSVKKARRRDRDRPTPLMLLMMFRSAMRDTLKKKPEEAL